MSKKRDYSKFEVQEPLSEKQEAFLAKRAKTSEPPPIDKSMEMFVKSVLSRYGWVRSRNRQAALVKARVARGKYRCESCEELFSANDIEVDHKVSKVQPSGSNTLEDWIRRTFCDVNFLAVLCKPCHRKCTAHDHYS